MTISLTDTLNQAIECLQNNQLEKAEKIFNGLLHLQADNIDVLHLLGLVKIKQGNLDAGNELFSKAIDLCKESLEDDKDDLSLNLLMAYLYIDLQQWANAEPYFKKTLEINPDLSEAYNGLGSIYYKSGKFQRAFSMFYQATKKDSSNVDAFFNQGLVLRAMGKLTDAYEAFLQVIKLAPSHITGISSLALTLQELGDSEKAKMAYQRVLSLSPNNGFAKHMLAALEGQNESMAPSDFVVELYDSYAPFYEEHLQNTLQSKAPIKIVETLLEQSSEALSSPLIEADVLDLGCGTGLVGVQLMGKIGNIDGIDLSRQMLVLAAQKKCYRELIACDIESFLNRTKQKYDYCVASDVLIYLGDLASVFKGVYQTLTEGGCFIFTTECCDEVEYSLLTSGRFAHSNQYIFDLAGSCQFKVRSQIPLQLRKEEGVWLDGSVHVLQK